MAPNGMRLLPPPATRAHEATAALPAATTGGHPRRPAAHPSTPPASATGHMPPLSKGTSSSPGVRRSDSSEVCLTGAGRRVASSVGTLDQLVWEWTSLQMRLAALQGLVGGEATPPDSSKKQRSLPPDQENASPIATNRLSTSELVQKEALAQGSADATSPASASEQHLTPAPYAPPAPPRPPANSLPPARSLPAAPSLPTAPSLPPTPFLPPLPPAPSLPPAPTHMHPLAPSPPPASRHIVTPAPLPPSSSPLAAERSSHPSPPATPADEPVLACACLRDGRVALLQRRRVLLWTQPHPASELRWRHSATLLGARDDRFTCLAAVSACLPLEPGLGRRPPWLAAAGELAGGGAGVVVFSLDDGEGERHAWRRVRCDCPIGAAAIVPTCTLLDRTNALSASVLATPGVPTAAFYLVAGCADGRARLWPLSSSSEEPMLLPFPWDDHAAADVLPQSHASPPAAASGATPVLDVSMLCNKLNILLVSYACGSATYQLPQGLLLNCFDRDPSLLPPPSAPHPQGAEPGLPLLVSVPGSDGLDGYDADGYLGHVVVAGALDWLCHMPDPTPSPRRAPIAARRVSIGRYECDCTCAYRLPPSCRPSPLAHLATDGAHLAAALRGGACLVWRLDSAAALALLPPPSPLPSPVASPLLASPPLPSPLLPCLLGAHDIDGRLRLGAACELLLVSATGGQWHCTRLDLPRRAAGGSESQPLDGCGSLEQSLPVTPAKARDDLYQCSPAPLSVSQLSEGSPSQFVQRFAY
ncbi:hypothetical protein AB1Y20_001476 [Prymnesium parvum]|uniref:Uncharacterized protein n=1 Tax=Prymnesium parvum TaxID=97485 RepID=A0AB34KC55_PRYPA